MARAELGATPPAPVGVGNTPGDYRTETTVRQDHAGIVTHVEHQETAR